MCGHPTPLHATPFSLVHCAAAVYLVEKFPSHLLRAINRLSLIRPHGSTPASTAATASGSGSSTPSTGPGGAPALPSLLGWYPFAISGINVTRILVDLLHMRGGAGVGQAAAASAVAKEQPGFWAHMTDIAVFNKLFVLSMLVLEMTFATSENLTVNDFNTCVRRCDTM